MRHALRVIGILAFTAIVLFALWAARTRSTRRADRASIKDTIQSAITNPADFAKTHFTGGIGVIVATDPATGVPVINAVAVGSPAEKAGLRKADIILKVNGEAASGRTLAQNIESIRGFAAGSVTLTVQHNGSTNLQCVIRRNSWKRLRGLSYNPSRLYGKIGRAKLRPAFPLDAGLQFGRAFHAQPCSGLLQSTFLNYVADTPRE